ncbi:MAG TPA: CBS domain-containing protein [Candidatus Binatia bacterium]|nr:CBS domain-containing protein [Candidatus Binatia bacterium]
MTTVGDVMTKAPMTIDPQAPLGTAVAVMRERGLRHLPVVDDAGQLLGVVTDRDLRGAAFAPALAEYLPDEARGRLRGLATALDDVRVRDVMTWGAMTIGPGAPVAQAAAVMTTARIGCLPVIDGGRLVGIVTEHDALKAVAAALPAVRGADPDTYFW